MSFVWKWVKISRKKIAFSLSLCLSAQSLLFFVLLLSLDRPSVFFVRWFWAPFFEQVVYAVGVLFVTSASDVYPVVQRHFRLFD